MARNGSRLIHAWALYGNRTRQNRSRWLQGRLRVRQRDCGAWMQAMSRRTGSGSFLPFSASPS